MRCSDPVLVNTFLNKSLHKTSESTNYAMWYNAGSECPRRWCLKELAPTSHSTDVYHKPRLPGPADLTFLYPALTLCFFR